MGDFYGTGIEIWAGFGQVGNTEKKIWADYEQLLMPLFHVFMVKIFFKNIADGENIFWHRMKLKIYYTLRKKKLCLETFYNCVLLH